MEELDNNKVPSIGKDGEKYRDIQIIVQLPRQDLSQEHCRHLQEADQRKAFDEFRQVRDATAMDLGVVKSVADDTVCILIIFTLLKDSEIFLKKYFVNCGYMR